MKRQLLWFTVLLWAGCLAAQGQAIAAPHNKYVRLTSTNLPIVWLTVDSTVQQDQRITARMKILHNGDGQINYADTVAHPGQHIDYDGYIALRYRGRSSYTYSSKKPYSLRPLNKPLEQGGSWVKVSLLGMGKDNNWALLAPYADKSMIRDMLAFEISRPWMEYTPQGRYCELIYNGTYYGVFILSEVVSKGRYRLHLDDPGEEGDEITGGYMMEVERNDDVEEVYRSRRHPVLSDGTPITTSYIYFQYKIPDYEDLTIAQRFYIQQSINSMETALAFDRYRDQETGECTLIDEMSFIDYQLAMEIGHNVDGYRLSGKFFKRRDSQDPRFKMVVWDMNLAYGNANYHDGWRTDTWIYQMNDLLHANASASTNMVPFWWYTLNNDDTYVARLKQRWAQYRTSNLTIDSLYHTIDSLTSVITIGGAEQRNYMAYPIWGKYVWPNYYIARNYNDEIAYLKRWLRHRIKWMDQQLGFEGTDTFIKGDINDDDEVNIADVGALTDIILSDGTALQADVNGDGEVTIADVASLIDLILQG